MTVNKRSLFTDLEYLALQQPEKVALIDNAGQTLTYKNLFIKIVAMQAWLASLGVKPGDTLIALMPNSIETITLFLASFSSGLCYAPLPCTATLAEIKRWKSMTKADYCVFAHSIAFSLKEEIKKLEWKNFEITRDMEFSALSKHLPNDAQGSLIMGSSGSTGEPKAIVLDTNSLWSAAYNFLQFHKIETSEMRFWNYLPMSYLGGIFNLTLIPLAAGASVYVDDAFNGKTFLTFWSTVERLKINSIWLVPTILRGLLALAEKVGPTNRPLIQHCFLGTAPISLEEKENFYKKFGVQPLENYGLSETTFISSENLGNISQRSQSSVGSLMPNVEIKLKSVINDDEAFNEIWVKTPYMMLGYLNDSQPFLLLDDDGFFCTGDYGKIINGQLQVVGRHRDIIKKGGILISLREIELVSEAFAKVVEAVAIKVPHQFYGESCHLYLRLAEAAVDPKDFITQFSTWLHAQMVRHKWPEQIFLCDDFPRTASGKIQKHLLSGSESYA